MVVQRVEMALPGTDVLVVNDGSDDATSIVGKAAGARVVSHRQNRGKGAALQTGFDALLQNPRVQMVATLDADLQHRPEDLPAFIAEMQRSGADIVVGRRERWGTRMPLHRRMSNAITSALVRARSGLEIEDSQSGFRLIRRTVLEHVRITSSGFEAETEFLLRAARAGFRVSSVPIHTIYSNAASHMTHWRTTVNFIRVLFQEY